MTARDNYFSFMKGIAITAVLFIHTPFMSGEGMSAICIRQLVNFAVAMFFFLSGFFIKDEHLDLKGIKRIIVPYAVWSVLWFAETTISGSQPITNWKIINTLFFGGAFFPLYFLIVLVELKLISPWMVQHIKRVSQDSRYKFYKDWALLITPITLIVLYIIQYQTHRQPAIYAQIFPTWFIFYYVGALMKIRGLKGNPLVALCCTLAGLYFSIVESAVISENIGIPFWGASQIKFSCFFYAMSLCILFLSLHKNVARNFVARLGELSFGIYLLHIPVMKMLSISHLRSVGGVNQVLMVIVTLCACYLILISVNKLLPRKICRWLGFI